MTHSRTKNPIVYLAALIVSGVLTFLGFRTPAWARAALGSEPHASVPHAEEGPALARAAISTGKHEPAARPTPARAASKRSQGAKKAKPARSKKVATQRTARERTESLRSSL